MYNRRMLGVTNERKLGGTIFKFTGAANDESLTNRALLESSSALMLTDVINRAAKWARMKMSKMLHCADAFYNAVGAEDVTY